MPLATSPKPLSSKYPFGLVVNPCVWRILQLAYDAHRRSRTMTGYKQGLLQYQIYGWFLKNIRIVEEDYSFSRHSWRNEESAEEGWYQSKHSAILYSPESYTGMKECVNGTQEYYSFELVKLENICTW